MSNCAPGDEDSVLLGSITTFVNPYSYRRLRMTRPAYLSETSMRMRYDGISMVFIARLLGDRFATRESFDDTSIAPEVFVQCASRKLSVALVGSVPGVAHQAAELLCLKHPGLNVIFTADGFFRFSSKEEALARASGADVVICSMGTPNQEDFLLDLKRVGWMGAGFTCGGYFDQLVASGGGSYYPKWINALDIRWLYRIFREPRRLLPRYCIDYPLGAALFAMDRLTLRRSIARS